MQFEGGVRTLVNNGALALITRKCGLAAVYNITLDPDVRYETYTVENQDSLAKIADAVYGERALWPFLCAANKPPIQNCDDLEPGWVLKTPPRR